jgi:hypothetical protein
MSQFPITIQYPDGQRVEAVSTTEHSASSHGLPVVVVNGEALGALDFARLGLHIIGGPLEIVLTLKNAGYPVPERQPGGPFDATLHPDGSATYWSVISQEWRTVAHQDEIPDVEWAARGQIERAALMAHLPGGERCEWGGCTETATEIVEYPGDRPSMHLCSVCAEVARAEAAHLASVREATQGDRDALEDGELLGRLMKDLNISDEEMQRIVEELHAEGGAR